jgi:hypothetical protein
MEKHNRIVVAVGHRKMCAWRSRRDVVAMPHPVALAAKTLDRDGRRLSSIVPSSWRQVLKNVSQALPVSKVFFIQGFADACGASLPAMPAQDWA